MFREKHQFQPKGGESMRTLLPILLICVVASAALAQEKPPTPVVASQDNPLSAWNKRTYGSMKKILVRYAEKMPEENYNFKPTDAVRSYGQTIGHIADSQYTFCSIVLGEKNPAPGIEKAKTSKADLIAALKDAFAYCDKAYDGMTDASGSQIVKFMGIDTPKLGVLTANMMHTMGHRGNLVTYMRMKNIVPPTSDPEFMQELMKK
jgi:uncharacterized damage-inducible protein DinB